MADTLNQRPAATSPRKRTPSMMRERVLHVYWRLKTIAYYRFFFRSIGAHSSITRPILLVNTEHVKIGSHVTIRHGARIECVLTPGGPDPLLEIGDCTNIEQNAHIICRSRMHIGKYVTITGNCSIVDVNHPYEDITDRRQIGMRIDPADAPVEIGDYTFIGMNSVILPGVTIGKHCVIAAGSIVTASVPDFCVVAGQPARVIRRYDLAAKAWLRVAADVSAFVSTPP